MTNIPQISRSKYAVSHIHSYIKRLKRKKRSEARLQFGAEVIVADTIETEAISGLETLVKVEILVEVETLVEVAVKG